MSSLLGVRRAYRTVTLLSSMDRPSDPVWTDTEERRIASVGHFSGGRGLLVGEVGVEGLAAAAGALRRGVGEAEAAAPVRALVVEHTTGDHRQPILLDGDAHVGGGLEDNVVGVHLVELEVHLEALAATEPEVDPEGGVG